MKMCERHFTFMGGVPASKTVANLWSTVWGYGAQWRPNRRVEA